MGWIRFLELYLPPEWRHELDDTSPAKGDWKTQCRVITRVLHDAREYMDADLLSILGFNCGRWPVVYEIISRLLDYSEATRSRMQRGRLPSNFDWAKIGSFDFITSNLMSTNDVPPILRNKDHPSLSSYDAYAEDIALTNRMADTRPEFGVLEEIWQSLGNIVLQAADLPPSESSAIMTYFYRIVARLHHMDCVPHPVYKYSLNDDLSSPNRPPGMHILAPWMMNSLSDAAWQASEAELAAKAAAAGEKLPPKRFKMRTRQLGPEVWLEFVLWCCVEGGFAKEGVWILKRLQDRQSKWCTIRATDVVPSPDSIDHTKIDRHETWDLCHKNSTNGNNTKNQGPFLGLGNRTISQEVISALIDGLINFVRVGVGYRGDIPSYILKRMNSIRPLLQEARLLTQSNEVEALIARMIESQGIVLETEPRGTESVLQEIPFTRIQSEDVLESKQVTNSLDKGDTLLKRSALVSGLYQYVLNTYAENGHVSGAISVFERLSSLQSTQNEKNRSQEFPGSPVPENFEITSPPSSLTTQFSNVSLSLLLDVATTSRAKRFAQRLLAPPQPETPAIPPELMKDKIVASSVLRFAAATKTSSLLTTVSEQVGSPLPTLVLKALINYTIDDHDWTNTRQLLDHLRVTRTSHWSIGHITGLAAAVLRLEAANAKADGPSSQHTKDSLKQAMDILIHLLEGRYNLKRDFSKAPYKYQEATLYELRQIFRTIPGALSEVCKRANLQWKRPHGPLRFIPSFAFNALLSAIVEIRGSHAGRQLWRRWCVDPQPPQARRIQPGGNTLLYFTDELDPRVGGVEAHFDSKWHYNQAAKLVRPDLGTVRLIARAALSEIDEFSSGRQPLVSGEACFHERSVQVLQWCEKMFKKFRFNDEEIRRELNDLRAQIQEHKRGET